MTRYEYRYVKYCNYLKMLITHLKIKISFKIQRTDTDSILTFKFDGESRQVVN